MNAPRTTNPIEQESAAPVLSNRHFIGKVVEAEEVAPEIWIHGYRLPEVARHAQPGQFVHLRLNDGTAPLLRRPFSILDVYPGEGVARILFKVVGTGTRILAGKRPGETVDVLAPLGTSFRVPENVRRLVLVAGGIGMVPLYFLSRELSAARPGIEIDYWFGARSGQEVYLLEDLRQWCRRVEAVTEDGSAGHKGRVPDHASEWRDADMIAACGPIAMLRAVQDVTADWPVPVHAALESFMGCGLGACLGCVLDTVDGFERVCTEGPVFDLRRLRLEVST